MADDRNDKANDPNHFTESASDRAHGTHGKGDSRETRIDPAPGTPDGSHDSSIGAGGRQGGSDGWGDAASGGSTIDRTSEKHRGSGGTGDVDESRT